MRKTDIDVIKTKIDALKNIKILNCNFFEQHECDVGPVLNENM